MNDSTIVVIGSGSTGSSTAFHLAKAGARTILIDRGQVASGMTSKSTAIVRTHYSNEIVARMALYSLRIFEHFGSIGNAGFVQNGMVILANDKIKKGLEENVKMLNSIGVRNMVLDKTLAKERFPELDFDDSDYVLFEPESGYADPVATAVSYSSKARELGAQVVLGRSVEKLDSENGKLVGVTLSDGERIKCSKAIICTNIWTNKLLARSGVKSEETLPIWAVAHPVVIFRRPQNYTGVKSTVSDFPNKTYYKPEGQSLLFAGSLDAALDNERIDPDQPPAEVPFEFMNFFSEALSKRIPVMSDGVFHSSYIGMYDISPDQHPIIDELPEEMKLKGAYCCVGLSGHGFKLCPAFGIMNSEMLLSVEEDKQTFNHAPFALSRFKEGRLLKTKYESLGTIA